MLEQLKRLLSRSALQLSPQGLTLLAGSKPYVLDGRALDPQLHLVAKAYETESPLYMYPVQLARQHYETEAGVLDSPLRTHVTSKDRTITLGTGASTRSIGIRIYTPLGANSIPRPVMVYYHGGGWAIGGLNTVDALCSGFAEDLNHIVISVDYRLAPEFKFPAATDDALDSFLWAKNNARHYGGDANKVYVAGDSAGGNLAAVVCQQTVIGKLPTPCAQILIYPATDLRNITPSHHTFAEGFPLSGKTINWFVDHYLSTEEDKLNIKASPGLATGDWLSDLPPAVITTAGFDVLRDEGQQYAELLSAAGVSVEYKEYPTLMHAYVSMTGVVTAAQQAVEDVSMKITQLIRQL